MSGLWRILRGTTVNRPALSTGKPVRGYRVGRHAFDEAVEGRVQLIDGAMKLFPEPVSAWPHGFDKVLKP